MGGIYFDNAATTRPLPQVVQAMTACLEDNYGNPSSLHRMGSQAEMILRESRQAVAKLLHAKEKDIYFTSGGTESNNLALLGAARAKMRQGKHIITSAVEHPSVAEPCRRLEKEGFEVTVLPVDRQGIISPDALGEALRKDTILVSLMAVNNEIGSLQDWAGLSDIIHRFNPEILFHVDGIQAFGKFTINAPGARIDLFSGSAHKIHGPKGTGFLYVGERARILPIQQGGGQEKDLRSGTENVPGIAGLGAAARILQEEGMMEGHLLQVRQIKERMIRGMRELPDIIIHSEGDVFSPYILNASFLGIRSEVLLHALEDKGIYVSAGSACSSHKREMSPVLKAIGLSKGQAESALRFSFSHLNTMEEAEETLAVLEELLPALRRFIRK